jgi:malate/lactate dehydrogenase
VAGADAIVIADRFAVGEWRDDEALVLLKQLGGAARRAIVVCAGASGAALVDRGVRELKLPRQRLFGTAPEALASGVRALVALQMNGSASDVALCVVGRPPADAVVSWNDATIGGLPLSSVLDEPVRRRLDAKMKALWPPGPLALGAAVAAALAAIDGRSRRFATCFVGPDLSAGERTRAAALPVRLARSGIVEVVMPVLSAGERVALENAMLL